MSASLAGELGEPRVTGGDHSAMAKTHSLRIARTPHPGSAKDGRVQRRLPLRYRIPLDLAAAVALTYLSALASMAEEPDGAAGEIVAAQIRTQGFECTLPVSAVRDRAASRPNVTVWVLNCGNARYQVRLVPDMAAQVTQLK
jgi:hypothetical protein